MDSRGKAFQTEETVLARFLCQREKKKKKWSTQRRGKRPLEQNEGESNPELR